VRDSEKLLPAQTDFAALFEHYVLEGDQDKVQYLYENTEVTVDFIHLFEKMFEKIDASAANAIKLAAVAEYFYQNSDLYRSYALFRIGNLKMKSVVVETREFARYTCLIQMFIAGNREAFALYAHHGPSPSACHLSTGGVGFNALQAIIFYAQDRLDLSDYASILIQHGAGIETCRMPYQPLGIALMRGDEWSTTQDAYSYSDGRKVPLREVMEDQTMGITQSRLSELEALSNSSNIVNFSTHFAFGNVEAFYRTLLPLCSEELLLRELTNAMKSIVFFLHIHPSRVGGCSFYADEAACMMDIRNYINLDAGQDDWYGLCFQKKPDASDRDFDLFLSRIGGDHVSPDEMRRITQEAVQKGTILYQPGILGINNKTVRIYVCPNPAHNETASKAKGIVGFSQGLEVVKVLYALFIERYDNLSPNERSDLIQEIRRDAVRCEVGGDPMQATTLYLAAITAQSLTNPMQVEDYRLLFSVLHAYIKNIKKMTPSPEEGNVLGNNFIMMSFAPLIGSLDPLLVAQLADTQFFKAFADTMDKKSSHKGGGMRR
jgi:hypothetical protein